MSEKVGRSCVGGTKQKEVFKLFIRESKHLVKNDNRTARRHKTKSAHLKRSPSLYKGEPCVKDQRQYRSEMLKYQCCILTIYIVMNQWQKTPQNISDSPFPIHSYFILRKEQGKKIPSVPIYEYIPVLCQIKRKTIENLDDFIHLIWIRQ